MKIVFLVLISLAALLIVSGSEAMLSNLSEGRNLSFTSISVNPLGDPIPSPRSPPLLAPQPYGDTIPSPR